MNDAVAEKHDFGAEVGRLLDLVVHSLYSEREIFLRELVANAADAMDRRRFEALTDAALAPPAEAKVRIVPDKEARTLLIADDGIGMGRQELIDNLGTIARSGTRAFGAALASAKPEERPSLIGQFGVGFYSAFMVADRVEVTSRKAGSEEAFTWASDGGGQFTVAPATRETAGTDVVLQVKADADEYLDPIRLEAIVRKWADHITLPITITRDGKDLPANEGTALWRKPRADVSEQSYNEFYRHLGHLFERYGNGLVTSIYWFSCVLLSGHVVPAGERHGTIASHGPEDDERNNPRKALRTPPSRMNGWCVAVFCSDIPIFPTTI